MLDPNQDILGRAVHLLRSAYHGTLLVDGAATEAKCMIDPKTGRFVVQITKETIGARDVSIASPRDCFDTKVRISMAVEEGVSEEQRDRFCCYHLPTNEPVLGVGTMEFAKLDSGEVVTADECPLVNPIVSEMAGLCRALNGDREGLARLTERKTGSRPESPIAVGVDPFGIDVRSDFGLVRLAFGSPIREGDDAMGYVMGLIGEQSDA